MSDEKKNSFLVLYISSPSRSGSSVIEESIAKSLGGVNCGELYRIRDFIEENNSVLYDKSSRLTCSCGRAVKDCDFWKDAFGDSSLSMSSDIFRSQIGPLRRNLMKIIMLFLGARFSKYLLSFFSVFRREFLAAENCFKVYSAISNKKDTSLIVDSSKQIHQYLLLKTLYPENIINVSVVRNGRAVVSSMKKGDRERYFVDLLKYSNKDSQGNWSHQCITKLAVRLWRKSILMSLFAYFTTKKGKRVFIRYESFCENPDKYVDLIRTKFQLKRANRSISEVHAIGGSPSRYTRGFTEITVDESWKEEWSEMDEMAFGPFDKLINKLMGYPYRLRK